MPINIRFGDEDEDSDDGQHDGEEFEYDDDDFDDDEEQPLKGEPVYVDGDIAPGPDDRDKDLMDGSWEKDYYAHGKRGLDWNAISIGLGIIVLAGLVLPGLLVIFR